MATTGLYTCSKCKKQVPMKYEVCPFCKTPRPANAAKQRDGGILIPVLVAVASVLALFIVGIIAVGVLQTSTAGKKPPTSTSPTISADPGEDEDTPSETPSEPSSQGKVFNIGETWIVDGQWEFTITGVTETDDRNQYSEKKPGAVYIVDFTYKNIGYEDDIMDGLFFDISSTIVDNAGEMGYGYPNTVVNVAKATPVGATCKAQECIGVDNPGDFKIMISEYDGNSEKRSATFNLNVSV